MSLLHVWWSLPKQAYKCESMLKFVPLWVSCVLYWYKYKPLFQKLYRKKNENDDKKHKHIFIFFDFFLISYSFYIHSFLIHCWYANKKYVSLLLEASISLAYLYHFFSFRNEIWFVYANCCFFRYLYCIFLKVSLSSRKFFELILKMLARRFFFLS